MSSTPHWSFYCYSNPGQFSKRITSGSPKVPKSWRKHTPRTDNAQGARCCNRPHQLRLASKRPAGTPPFERGWERVWKAASTRPSTCNLAVQPERWRRSADRVSRVSAALAAELNLKLPDAPWHAYRDRLAALLAALSIYTATLGKMALDVALMMQFEVSRSCRTWWQRPRRFLRHATQTQSHSLPFDHCKR